MTRFQRIAGAEITATDADSTPAQCRGCATYTKSGHGATVATAGNQNASGVTGSDAGKRSSAPPSEQGSERLARLPDGPLPRLEISGMGISTPITPPAAPGDAAQGEGITSPAHQRPAYTSMTQAQTSTLCGAAAGRGPQTRREDGV